MQLSVDLSGSAIRSHLLLAPIGRTGVVHGRNADSVGFRLMRDALFSFVPQVLLLTHQPDSLQPCQLLVWSIREASLSFSRLESRSALIG